ncbi:Spo0E family sporulation regulatory protein-aspartic acid phosphatase (plasmid) [Crassaminicella thermophila]|uniref:Spo0E family sporulation regulatory protein-aspartic acid phosphatase n=1 Tax=Crassaminicella thermophila TaxID=2599308 RepID=A0A5C0SK67_CRATE|nr:Spo0E family sporulation regulatory protein-aspartic acid phosphatase [Crassaminicella thermophila]QEK13754.1 Spo0E family sporulation regulatory protein-aspartic acid phosphatase [Crassaminicella thermophila]
MNSLKIEKKKLDYLIAKYDDLQHPAVQKQSRKVDKLVVEHMREVTA